MNATAEQLIVGAVAFLVGGFLICVGAVSTMRWIGRKAADAAARRRMAKWRRMPKPPTRPRAPINPVKPVYPSSSAPMRLDAGPRDWEQKLH